MLARRGPPWNSLRCVAAPFRQPRRVRARSLRVLRHAGAPAALCFSARPHGQGTTRAVAALGPGWGSAGALRRRAAPRRPGQAKQRPVSFPRPSVCAEEHRARGGRVCRRTRPLRDLTRRGCPSGARQRAASSTAPPRDRAPQVAHSAAEGRRQQGRLSIGYFSLAKQRKAPRPPGRDPARGSSASAAAQKKRKTVHLSKAQKRGRQRGGGLSRKPGRRQAFAAPMGACLNGVVSEAWGTSPPPQVVSAWRAMPRPAVRAGACWWSCTAARPAPPPRARRRRRRPAWPRGSRTG
ncbi:hypothetical protein QE399_002962 [Paracidovorax wautersii]|uniref:Uncharacterized protein n=1 Tax=Paracidovorax wautersii TaxID=1177982 RepID=A0ABU1IFA7_9BURK|nr:hypothetical protein [Paracidovorax wautersii]